MSENLRKLLSSNEMPSVPVKTGTWKTTDKPTSGIKWIPIDTTKISSTKLSEHVLKQSDKAVDKGRQADLKVFEVRFPSAALQKDAKSNKSVTFQLIPLKSLPCVNAETSQKKVHTPCTAPKLSSPCDKKFDPPTKKLRTGTQHARPQSHSPILSRDVTAAFTEHAEGELMPGLGDFAFYKQFSEDGLLQSQMDTSQGEVVEGTTTTDYWLDQFNKNLGVSEKVNRDHRVPEYQNGDYQELEKFLTSMNDSKHTFTPVYTQTQIKQENKENTILLKKRKRQSPKKSMFDICPPLRSKLSSMRNTQLNNQDEASRPKISSKVRNELELYTKTMNVSKSELVPEKVLARRKTIHNKLKQSGHLRFSAVEEYDIHQRAEIFMESVTPDKNFYLASDKEEQLKAFVDSAPPPRKRRKHFTIVDDMLVMAPYSRPGYDSYITLENGTRLLRPPTKLVELVAKAINDSPDCMLQVHQVYTVLQKRFPYFQYMDKGYLTSWRSSIRHALYQKWFRKVQFSAEVINNKGCYWAINRKFTPKEWNLPPKRPEHSSLESLSRRDAEMLQEMEKFAMDAALTATSTVTDALDDTYVQEEKAGSSFGTTTTNTTSSLWDSCLLDNLTLSASSTTSTATAPSSSYTFRTPRDPDPMLNLPNTRSSRNATPDPFDEPIIIEPDHSSQSPEPATQKSDDSGYFGNLLWSPLDRLGMELDPLSCLSPTAAAHPGGDPCLEEPLSLEQLLKVSTSLSPRLLSGPSW